MKRTNALIAAALAASMLTSCGGTDAAEMTSAESTVNETTANETIEMSDTATESDTETTPAESDVVTDSVALTLDTESDAAIDPVVENTDDPRWEALVCDLTQKYDITDWENGADTSEEYADVTSNEDTAEPIDKTLCTIQEAIDRLNIPDAVTSYLNENSLMYQNHLNNNELIRNISSGVKDFDFDGTDEMFYAVNYLHDKGSDIVIYRENDGIVYWNGTDIISNVGYYFESDPIMQRIAMNSDDPAYESYLTWEGSDMHFTDDNVFITADWSYNMTNDTRNMYYKVVSEAGVFRIEYVGKVCWCKGWEDTESGSTYYRHAYVDGDTPCILIQQ